MSNDYRDPGNGNAAAIAFEESRAKWTKVTDAAVASFLNNPPPVGGKPGGSPGDGALVIPVCFAALRWRATYVSGSGNYTLDAELN